MLKAYMIKKEGKESIYYKDHPERTLGLGECVRQVFTNDKDPLRKNLEKIIELRNTSTHFIMEEYAMVYIPLFQAAVFNFIEKMQAFHGFDMSELIPANFLTLAVSYNPLNAEDVRTKYPEEISERLIAVNNELAPMIHENGAGFAIRVDHYYYLTKDKNAASASVRIDSGAETGIKIVKEIKDPNLTHGYTAKKCIAEIRRRLKKLNINEVFNNGEGFNMWHFNLFCKYYGIKENPRLCYVTRAYAQPIYGYSMLAIEFIVEEIRKDPENIVEKMKRKK